MHVADDDGLSNSSEAKVYDAKNIYVWEKGKIMVDCIYFIIIPNYSFRIIIWFCSWRIHIVKADILFYTLNEADILWVQQRCCKPSMAKKQLNFRDGPLFYSRFQKNNFVEQERFSWIL